MSIEKKLAELEKKFKRKNKEDNRRYNVYDALFKQIYDIPVVVACVAEYSAEIRKISKEMKQFNGEAVLFSRNKEEETKDLQEKLSKKQNELEQMVRKFAIAHSENEALRSENEGLLKN